MKKLSAKDFKNLNSKNGLLHILSNEEMNLDKTLRYVRYEERLADLQVELIKLQQWVSASNEKVVIVFEGRDAAGKGGAIRRMTEFLNPREYRVIALPKPDEIEKTQWYFQRYISLLPKAGEILFFDRSWYNRAVVEPVNGFCSDEEYEVFMNQVNDVERIIVDSGVRIIKLYFSISKDEQARRFKDIIESPLKKWKYSAVDHRAIELWDEYTSYKQKMFDRTDTEIAPWKIIKANRKTKARIDAIEHVLNVLPYRVEDEELLKNKELEQD
ncbi:MAG: polyphosphate kinase 2 [Chitinophagales bacterium]